MNPSYQCAPLAKEHIDKNNWRNLVVADIIKSSKLRNIVVIPWFSFTQDLWDLHPSGSQHDCTHFCSTPMLYNPIYTFIDKNIGAPEPVSTGGHHGKSIVLPDGYFMHMYSYSLAPSLLSIFLVRIFHSYVITLRFSTT